MEYRVNKRTGDRVSVVGLGTSVIAEEGESEGIKTKMGEIAAYFGSCS